VETAETLMAAEGELAVPQQVMSNSLGLWDGNCFYLRSFPVWYRWRVVTSSRKQDKPESGNVNGVEFEQSMGRMVLWYHLQDQDANLTEEDLLVELSCWQVQVSIGRDIQYVKGKSTGRKIDGLCNDLFDDIRRNLSWWELSQDPGGDGKWLAIHLTKQEHRGWKGPWFTEPFHPHRRTSFPWSSLHYPPPKRDDDKLARIEPGLPQDVEKELYTGLTPEKLCTGMDVEEDAWSVTVLIHLDEEGVEVATAKVPMEEMFSADVRCDALDIFLRNEGFGIMTSRLNGYIVPELSLWEITSIRRTNLPKDGRIKCPAFYNPAIRIKLTKADGSQGMWEGGVFADVQKAAFEAPRERMTWTERVQRALVLSPGAPLKNNIKAENALKMCTRVETSQDTVTQRANIMFHLDEALEELAFKFKLDLTTFFALKVGERMIEVSVVADSEFTMCVGDLGGAVEQDKTKWEIGKERDSPTSEKEHLVLKISLAKAAGSRDRWPEIFKKLESWEVAERMKLPEPAATEAIAEGEEAAAEKTN